ncbi:Leucine rich repeat-containing protein [Ruminococcus sp. YRD2003]|uniref:leucine-rich repeat domain-containing protein n=1 Tax=Ruminococcus sp. YRD2003 TaxID=1452313 RepID=UPI0008C20613|nr:Leucine rich repeat-containing protein [Ruminococcus flavefaciens]
MGFNINLGGLLKYTSEPGVTEVTIPDGVRFIRGAAFAECTSLTSITIPDSVTEIDNYAFMDCTSLTSVTIPDSVTRIGNFAFSNCTSLSSVTVPDGVKWIPGSAFENCPNIETINVSDNSTAINYYHIEKTKWAEYHKKDDFVILGKRLLRYKGKAASAEIPDGVVSIGAWAFKGCKGLKSLTIPDSVTKIDELSFEGGEGIETINVSRTYTALSYPQIKDTKWFKDNTGDFVILGGNLIRYQGKAASVTIPDGTAAIGDEAFRECDDLKSVKIPDSITKIGRCAFGYCSDLTSMTLPLADIGEYAITECSVSKLNIILPDGSTMPVDFGAPLRESDFAKVIDAVQKGDAAEKVSSTGLKNKLLMYQYIYTRNETIEKKFKTAISKLAETLIDEKNADAFKVLASTGLIDERKLVKIEDYAKNRKNIAKIKDIITELRNSLDGAKETAPKKAAKTSKKAADTPTDVFNIQSGRLKGLSGNDFKEIILPDNVTNIDKGAFLSVKVKKLLLSGSLKKLTGQVFKDCTGLAEVVISEGTESIGKEAFRGCTSLKAVTIPSSVTTIGASAFMGCTKLKEVNISEGTAEIEDSAFAECSALTEIVIPATVKSIGNKLFKNCKKLTSVTMPGNQVINFDECFDGCKKLETITFTAKDSKYRFENGIVLSEKSGAVEYIAPGSSTIIIPEGTKRITVKTAIKELTINYSKGQHIDIKTTSVNILNFIHKGKTYTIDILEAKDMLDYAPFDFITSRLFPRKKEATLNLINGIVDIIIKGDIKPYTNYCYEALGEVCYSDGYENTTKVEPLLDLRKQLSEITAEIYGTDRFRNFSDLMFPVIECYYNDDDIDHFIGYAVAFFARNIEYFECLSDYPEMQEKILNKIAEAMINNDESDITEILDKFNQKQFQVLINAAQNAKAANVLAQLLEYNNNKFGGSDPLGDLSL